MLTKWMQGLHAKLMAEAGQGTVEYVALLVLLAAIFAVVVAAGGKDAGDTIAKELKEQITGAIGKVASK